MPASAAASKSREVMVRTPEELIEKNDSSVPDLLQVTLSLAVNVATAVVFSAMLLVLVEAPAEPDGPVMDGAVSSASVMVRVRV